MEGVDVGELVGGVLELKFRLEDEVEIGVVSLDPGWVLSSRLSVLFLLAFLFLAAFLIPPCLIYDVGNLKAIGS